MSKALTTELNPFHAQRETTALGQVLEGREMQEVQAAMAIARRFPRDPVAATDRILNACTRNALAEAALYSYNRGGQEVTGPSIRLAEVLAQGWGHMQCGVREVSSANGVSTVEAYAWDLETNFRDTRIFAVPHERTAKGVVKKLTDPRDIYELVANQGARRKRACILAVIPGDVVEAAVRQCELTLTANVDLSQDAIAKLAAAFDKFHVSRHQIEVLLGNRLESIRPAQVVRLRTIYRSLADGISAPESWFKPEPGASHTNGPIDPSIESLVSRRAATPPDADLLCDQQIKDSIVKGLAIQIEEANHQAALERVAKVVAESNISDEARADLMARVALRDGELREQSE